MPVVRSGVSATGHVSARTTGQYMKILWLLLTVIGFAMLVYGTKEGWDW